MRRRIQLKSTDAKVKIKSFAMQGGRPGSSSNNIQVNIQ